MSSFCDLFLYNALSSSCAYFFFLNPTSPPPLLGTSAGTGKTAVFSIGALQCLDTTSNETQVLTLSPTRELAEQSQKVCLALGDYMNVQCHACIGGKSIAEDIRRLDYGVQVVSGTPGRVFDMIRRRNLRTRNLKMLVWVPSWGFPPAASCLHSNPITWHSTGDCKAFTTVLLRTRVPG